MGRLIIDGNRVYELDEACLQKKKRAGQMTDAAPKTQMRTEREKRMQKRERS